MTQPKARPPFFVLFGNSVASIPESYKRYLVNGLRETFGLFGVADPPFAALRRREPVRGEEEARLVTLAAADSHRYFDVLGEGHGPVAVFGRAHARQAVGIDVRTIHDA